MVSRSVKSAITDRKFGEDDKDECIVLRGLFGRGEKFSRARKSCGKLPGLDFKVKGGAQTSKYKLVFTVNM